MKEVAPESHAIIKFHQILLKGGWFIFLVKLSPSFLIEIYRNLQPFNIIFFFLLLFLFFFLNLISTTPTGFVSSSTPFWQPSYSPVNMSRNIEWVEEKRTHSSSIFHQFLSFFIDRSINFFFRFFFLLLLLLCSILRAFICTEYKDEGKTIGRGWGLSFSSTKS